MSANDRSIPQFALFGVDKRETTGERVHCETIQIRSRRYNWEISAHRHPALCQMLLVTSGSARILLDDVTHEPTAPLLVVTPPGTIHGFAFSSDVTGYVVSLSFQLIEEFEFIAPPGQLLSSAAIYRLDPAMVQRLAAIAEQLDIVKETGSEADLLRCALAEAFVRTAAQNLSHKRQDTDDDLVRRFQALAARHLREQRNLPFYAAQLGCTERTLNRHVTRALDLSPMRYLNERIAAEATRLLRFTNASCEEVASELGFADPSYFSRFYTRMTGQRPSVAKHENRDHSGRAWPGE